MSEDDPPWGQKPPKPPSSPRASDERREGLGAEPHRNRNRRGGGGNGHHRGRAQPPTPQGAAFVINVIVSRSDVERIPNVVAAMLDGLALPRDRVAIVVGVNGRSGKPLDDAEARARQLLEEAQARHGLAGADVVKSTFTGRTFPYGTMRNEVLHSDSTREMIQSFREAGHVPYVSIQDFDDGSRRVGDNSGRHIFDVLNDEVERKRRPLMFGGGYRPSESQSGETRKGSPQTLQEAIAEDMAARDKLAAVSPGLPYVPEPNLFLDGRAVTADESLRFGNGAAEYTELAKNIRNYAVREMEQAAGRDPAHRLRIHPEHRPDGSAVFDVDFQRTIETDCSRLAKAWKKNGKLAQDHRAATIPADRFANTKADKTNTSMAALRDMLRDMSAAERSLFFDDMNKMTPGQLAALPGPGNQMSSALGLEEGTAQHAFLAVANILTGSGEVRGTPADGDCLFHTVLQHRMGAHTLADVIEMRTETALWVRQNQHRFADFLNADEIATLENRIATPGQWAGDLGDVVAEVIGLAHDIPMDINVYLDNGTLSYTYRAGPPTGHAMPLHLQGDHYGTQPPVPTRPQRPEASPTPMDVGRRRGSSSDSAKRRNKGKRRATGAPGTPRDRSRPRQRPPSPPGRR